MSEPIHNTVELLRRRFPQCFSPTGFPKRPLKAGIYLDIHRHCSDIPVDLILKAVADYCSDADYSAALEPDAVRIDLSGRPCGAVLHIDGG